MLGMGDYCFRWDMRAVLAAVREPGQHDCMLDAGRYGYLRDREMSRHLKPCTLENLG